MPTPNFGSISENTPPSMRPPTLVNGTPIGMAGAAFACRAGVGTCTV